MEKNKNYSLPHLQEILVHRKTQYQSFVCLSVGWFVGGVTFRYRACAC